MTRGRKAGFHHSEATKAKIGAGNKGKIITPEMRAKLRAAVLGKKRSPESIEKWRIAIRKRYGGITPPPLRNYAKKLHGCGIRGQALRQAIEAMQ